MVQPTYSHSNQQVDIRKPISYDCYGKLIGQANSNLLHHSILAPYTTQIETMIEDTDIEYFSVIQYCNGYSEYLRSFFFKSGYILQNLHVKLDFGDLTEIEDGTVFDFFGHQFKARRVAVCHYCFYRIEFLNR